MMRRSLQIALVASCTLFGCEEKPSGGPSVGPSAAPVGSLAVTTGDAGASSVAGAAKASAGATGSWTGTYTSKQAAEPAPRKADDDGTQGIGDGTVNLALAEDRTLKGTLDGPLGESVLSGTSTGDTMSGTLFPKQASPTSFYGTWVLTKSDGALKGKIVASRGNAGAVREAELTLKGK